MNTIFLFLIKSITVSGIMMLWYLLALKGKRLHNYNRFYLLITLYASLQIPLLNIQWFTVSHDAPRIVSSAAVILHELNDSDTATAMTTAHAASINYEQIIIFIAACISMLLLTFLLVRVLWIVFLRRKASHHSIVDGVQLIYTDQSKAPFSFLSWIFWREDIDPDSANGRLILQHELTHTREKHTYDKLASQLFTCIFWMNPFYWLIQKELNLVHEFVADEAAVGDHSADTATEAFAHMLLQVHNKGAYITPEHRFFSSPIKQRLIMLQTNKSIRYSGLRRLAILPLVAGSMLLFSFGTRSEKNPVAIKAEKKIVLALNAGHGGIDLGTTLGDLREKDINLKVCKRINELAPEYNVEVHMIRDEDEYVSLANTVKISNSLHPDYFISIHVNNVKGSNPAIGTFEIALNSKNANAEESKQLANAVYHNILRPGWEQGIASGEKSLYVLRENAAPSILIELGDIKNKTQMAQLNDNKKLDELCAAILRGVVESGKK